MVVCTLCSCYPRALLGPPPAWYKSLPYRSRAVSDPRGVLAEFGVELDDDVELRVLDSTADIRYLVIPRRPPGTRGAERGRAGGARDARRDDRRRPAGGARRRRLLAAKGPADRMRKAIAAAGSAAFFALAPGVMAGLDPVVADGAGKRGTRGRRCACSAPP